MVLNLKICPSCGKSEKQFVGSFCIDCFSKQQLVEVAGKNLSLTLCPRCLRVKSGSAWVEFTPKVVEEMVAHKSKSRFPLSTQVSFTQGKRFVGVHAKFHLKVDGHDVKQEKHFEIPFSKTLCLDCSRQAGGYKEAIVQIRGDERRVERVLQKLEKAIEGKTFWKTELKKTGGADLVAGSKNAVLDAVRSLKKPFSLSHKLTGVRNGKKVFLVTILIDA
ncbi:MAG: NMD3-related protein [Candidatus Norongarragalinales archaeon]